VDNPKSINPSFVPDVTGFYLAEGIGTAGQPPLRVKVYVGPKETLAPVQTWVAGPGGSRGIVVDGIQYFGSTAAGINILTLQRKTLHDVAFYTSDWSHGTISDVKTYLDAILSKQAADVILVICSDQTLGADVSQIAPELEKFGANTDFRTIPILILRSRLSAPRI